MKISNFLCINVKNFFYKSHGFGRINKFIRNGQKYRVPDYLLNNNIFYQFVNKFSVLLLCEINIFDIFNKVDFFSEFLIGNVRVKNS